MAMDTFVGCDVLATHRRRIGRCQISAGQIGRDENPGNQPVAAGPPAHPGLRQFVRQHSRLNWGNPRSAGLRSAGVLLVGVGDGRVGVVCHGVGAVVLQWRGVKPVAARTWVLRD
jgi:hypothetical protein